jgi:hypothetical protein
LQRLSTIIGVIVAFGVVISGATANATVTTVGGEAEAAGRTAPVAEQGTSEGPDGVIASYRGRRINLAKGWSDAQICAEYAPGDVRCYANETAYARDAGTDRPMSNARGLTDCPSGWGCVWQHPNYTGRRLQWSASGTYDLDKWNFRDKTSSVANRRMLYGVALINERWGPIPDEEFICALGNAIPDLRKHDWDNKADKVKL